MATAVKRLLVGRALRTEQASHERLTKKTALAVFRQTHFHQLPYATEEILLVLAVAAAATSGASFSYVIPISIGIAVLLGIVATSYRQTIHAYPSGGGAYIVAKENLGTTPGLIARASLLVELEADRGHGFSKVDARDPAFQVRCWTILIIPIK